MITQSCNLNLVPGIVLPRINVVQYDYGSRVLKFPIWDGEQRFTLTGAMSARIQGTKPDRLGFDYAATIDTSNNIVTADLTQQMTVIRGEVVCGIVLMKSNERIGTLNFILDVQPAALNDDTSTSESVLPDIIDQARANMLAAAASATEAKSYAEGGTNTRPGEDTDNAKYFKEQAEASAQAAGGSASDAASDALKAEGFANGEQNGQAVPSTSPYYHNNAEYFKDQAEAAAQDAAQWSGNPPYIGSNGHWWIYNTTTHAFVDSGIDASITVEIADITMLAYGATPYVTNTGTATDPVFHLYIPRGSSVTGCTKTSTAGLIDTYTMTFSDGYSTTFTVVNGKGISSITLDSSSGLVDTYTITYNDGTTQSYTVTNGKGISNIAKTGTSGLVDTYTITYNDGTTTTFDVTNGRDGIGSSIGSLSDVDITSPANKDGLVYNGTTGKWENKALKDVAFTSDFSDLTNTPTVDNALSTTSHNAVENQVITAEVNLWKALGLSVVSGKVCQTYTTTP